VILHLEDLAHREIAEVIGTSENAVATRLTRAKKTLRRLLEEGGTP
jgi:DNA-directed RNA polymerase specialized sigma24 family protein